MFEGFETRMNQSVMLKDLDNLGRKVIIAVKFGDLIQFGIYEGVREKTVLEVSDILTVVSRRSIAVRPGKSTIYSVKGVYQRPADLFILNSNDIDWLINEVENAGFEYDMTVSYILKQYKILLDED